MRCTKKVNPKFLHCTIKSSGLGLNTLARDAILAFFARHIAPFCDVRRASLGHLAAHRRASEESRRGTVSPAGEGLAFGVSGHRERQVSARDAGAAALPARARAHSCGTLLLRVSEALAAKKKSRTPSIAAAIVVDMNSGTILHSQAADTPRPPGLAHQDDDALCPVRLFAGRQAHARVPSLRSRPLPPARRRPSSASSPASTIKSQRCDQGPGHPIGQRRRRHHRREPCRHRGEFRPADDRDRPGASA